MLRTGLAVLAAVVASTVATAEPVDVYIFSGQSNMAGAAKLADLPETARRPVPEVRIWNGSAFESFTPGTTAVGDKIERFGPELGFAQAWAAAAPGKPCYIVKLAKGGRALHTGWDDGEWVGETPGPGRGNFYPGKTAGDPNAGVLYTALVERVNAALAHLKAQGTAYRVRGVVWMQGEADGKHPTSAAHYARNLRHFHERLLSDIGAPPCPLIYGQVLPHTPAHERFVARDEIRQAQANLDHDSGHADAYPWAHMVPTEGIDLSEDTVHYNAAGQLKLGKAFADAMQAVLAAQE